jgi:hypothetical protein
MMILSLSYLRDRSLIIKEFIKRSIFVKLIPPFELIIILYSIMSRVEHIRATTTLFFKLFYEGD